MADRNRDLTLWQVLVWTYRDQMAHRYLEIPGDWGELMVALDAPTDDTPRPQVNADAATLHGEVKMLGARKAAILISTALDMVQPEPPVQMPVPYPARADRTLGMADGERISWGRFLGQRVDFLIRWLEQITIFEPIKKRFGRRDKVIGYRPSQWQVEFCPVDWRPSHAYVIQKSKFHREWVEAMQALYEAVRGHQWKAITLTGDGIQYPHWVDTKEIEEGERIARLAGMIPQVDLDHTQEPVTIFRGVDEEGEIDAEYLTRNVRAKIRETGVIRQESLSRRGQIRGDGTPHACRRVS